MPPGFGYGGYGVFGQENPFAIFGQGVGGTPALAGTFVQGAGAPLPPAAAALAPPLPPPIAPPPPLTESIPPPAPPQHHRLIDQLARAGAGGTRDQNLTAGLASAAAKVGNPRRDLRSAAFGPSPSDPVDPVRPVDNRSLAKTLFPDNRSLAATLLPKSKEQSKGRNLVRTVFERPNSTSEGRAKFKSRRYFDDGTMQMVTDYSQIAVSPGGKRSSRAALGARQFPPIRGGSPAYLRLKGEKNGSVRYTPDRDDPPPVKGSRQYAIKNRIPYVEEVRSIEEMNAVPTHELSELERRERNFARINHPDAPRGVLGAHDARKQAEYENTFNPFEGISVMDHFRKIKESGRTPSPAEVREAEYLLGKGAGIKENIDMQGIREFFHGADARGSADDFSPRGLLSGDVRTLKGTTPGQIRNLPPSPEFPEGRTGVYQPDSLLEQKEFYDARDADELAAIQSQQDNQNFRTELEQLGRQGTATGNFGPLSQAIARGAGGGGGQVRSGFADPNISQRIPQDIRGIMDTFSAMPEAERDLAGSAGLADAIFTRGGAMGGADHLSVAAELQRTGGVEAANEFLQRMGELTNPGQNPKPQTFMQNLGSLMMPSGRTGTATGPLQNRSGFDPATGGNTILDAIRGGGLPGGTNRQPAAPPSAQPQGPPPIPRPTLPPSTAQQGGTDTLAGLQQLLAEQPRAQGIQGLIRPNLGPDRQDRQFGSGKYGDLDSEQINVLLEAMRLQQPALQSPLSAGVNFSAPGGALADQSANQFVQPATDAEAAAQEARAANREKVAEGLSQDKREFASFLKRNGITKSRWSAMLRAAFENTRLGQNDTSDEELRRRRRLQAAGGR